MKYRLEYDAARGGAPRWEFYGDFPTRVAAQQAERELRRRFGLINRTRISTVASDAPTPGEARRVES
ncbi:MAG TPA: hypothetical protein VHN78_00100 [Chloroflexota bacterium]|nr:hypothetical protein [Chloroflexota bacterium]HEX2183889.1 hypothetical protein [Chloroflexota bacterium]